MSYDYSINSSAFDGFLAGFMIFVGIIILIALVIGIITIIGTWKLLKKAGKPGWGSLIPIYREYLLCELAGVCPWWLLVIFVGGIVAAIPIIGYIAYMAAVIYFAILLNVGIARSFGKEDSYAIGLILLNPIFMCILGYGKSEYKGPNPMNDVIFKDNKLDVSFSQSTTSNAPDENIIYCSNCGSKLTKDTKFCSNCGAEIK